MEEDKIYRKINKDLLSSEIHTTKTHVLVDKSHIFQSNFLLVEKQKTDISSLFGVFNTQQKTLLEFEYKINNFSSIDGSAFRKNEKISSPNKVYQDFSKFIEGINATLSDTLYFFTYAHNLTNKEKKPYDFSIILTDKEKKTMGQFFKIACNQTIPMRKRISNMSTIISIINSKIKSLIEDLQQNNLNKDLRLGKKVKSIEFEKSKRNLTPLKRKTITTRLPRRAACAPYRSTHTAECWPTGSRPPVPAGRAHRPAPTPPRRHTAEVHNSRSPWHFR